MSQNFPVSLEDFIVILQMLQRKLITFVKLLRKCIFQKKFCTFKLSSKMAQASKSRLHI